MLKLAIISAYTWSQISFFMNNVKKENWILDSPSRSQEETGFCFSICGLVRSDNLKFHQNKDVSKSTNMKVHFGYFRSLKLRPLSELCPRLSIFHWSGEILGVDDHNHSLYRCTVFQQEELTVPTATRLTNIPFKS
jgi:hypothetical protein